MCFDHCKMDGLKLHQFGHQGFGRMAIGLINVFGQRGQHIGHTAELLFENGNTLTRGLFLRQSGFSAFFHDLICLYGNFRYSREASVQAQPKNRSLA